MPNGFHGPEAKWLELTAELAALDRELEGFASSYGLEIRRNERAWPNRRLRWRNDLERAIEIYLEDEGRRTYSVGASAYVDQAGRRYWHAAIVRQGVTVEALGAELPALLERGYRLASSWTFRDLEDMGEISDRAFGSRVSGRGESQELSAATGSSPLLRDDGGRGEADMTRDEVMALIGSRGDLFGAELRGRDFARANLSGISGEGADFSGASLREAVLVEATLPGALFRDADLTRARLDGACLVDADFTRAVLSDASLRGADLSGADLSSSNLSRADLRGAVLLAAKLNEAEMGGASVAGADIYLDDLMLAQNPPLSRFARLVGKLRAWRRGE